MNDFLKPVAGEADFEVQANKLLARGRALLLSAMAGAVLADLLVAGINLWLFGTDRLVMHSVRLSLTLLLMWQLFQGRVWAIRITVGLFTYATLTGGSTMIELLLSGDAKHPRLLALFAVSSLVYPLMIYLVTANLATKSFLAHQRRKR